MSTFERVLSGLPGFDKIVDFIRMGDNVVWQTDDISEYSYFLRPFIRHATGDGRNLIYIHFEGHPRLIGEEEVGVKTFTFNPDAGFETFTVEVHAEITREGRDAFYVFDTLSELQTAWASDLMMGNFFQVICPYLFELNTVAFFCLLRNRHSLDAVARIRDTTQLLLDIFHSRDALYVHPLKVWNRYSKTMFLPSKLTADGQDSYPLTDAVECAGFFQVANASGHGEVDCSLDNWDRVFLKVRNELLLGIHSEDSRKHLLSLLVGKDPGIYAIAETQFSTKDILRLKERIIGSGPIGGKAVGMLLARKIIENKLPEIQKRIEMHDSFFIGADVFYSFLVKNGWWMLRLKQKTDEGYYPVAEQLREKIPNGEFPEHIREQFRRMLSYFGQSPIIARSSSLLEDSFGNAFAGKYESVFCVNSGTPEERLFAFEKAVKEVFASTMDTSALAYRRQRGLDRKDEQMAILVQRVSGSHLGDFFMPTAAGVGYSHNSYVWNEHIDPAAGMLRIVAGLGTRAVARTESDYPRIAALDNPALMPVSSEEDKARFAQKHLDVLDLKHNVLAARALDEVAPSLPVFLRDLLCVHDESAEEYYRRSGTAKDVYYTNCGKILENASFISDMRTILETLQNLYDYPVDIEFTVNFSAGGDYVINMLQCRPLQIRGRGANVVIPPIPDDRIFFRLKGNTLGGGFNQRIDCVLAVDPGLYYKSDPRTKYKVARCIGKINRSLGAKSKILLTGPGRWGTSSPELGVPVNFSEISNIAAICEVSYQGGHILPELSFGSHFFQDLVETGVFYAAVFEGKEDCFYNSAFFPDGSDVFREIAEEADADLAGLVRFYQPENPVLTLKSDVLSGISVCGYF